MRKRRRDAPAPDVVGIDVEAATSGILEAGLDIWHAPPVPVLLTDDVYDDWIREGAPADGTSILPRSATPAEIVAAIGAAARGLCVLSPEILARLLTGARPPRQTPSAPPVQALTPREIEVLTMLAEGMSNKDIARHLDVSDNTFKFHLSSIFGKLGATSRTEAVMVGMRHGFIMV